MIKEEIVAVFNKNKKRYGYRRITQELHNNDICINHKTVQKLMKQLGLVCHVRERKKYNASPFIDILVLECYYKNNIIVSIPLQNNSAKWLL